MSKTIGYRTITKCIVGCLGVYLFPPKNKLPAASEEDAFQAAIVGQAQMNSGIWTKIKIIE